MSIEVILFVIVGAIAVAAAVMMLLSENAIHSALFLILNFGCVAFLFLLLDASFLAMVQIAVYAGAIMVLFLFVIMLLGAEQTQSETTRTFRWLLPLSLALALSFLIVVGVAVMQGDPDTRTPPPAPSMLRIAHAAAGFPDPADFYLNGEQVGAGMTFGDATSFTRITPGEYEVSIAVAGDAPQNAFSLGTVSVEAGQAGTVVAHGETRLPTLTVIHEDLSTLTGREGRLIVFNAYTGAPAVTLVDPGPTLTVTPNQQVLVIIESLEQGAVSEVLTFDEGITRRAFVRADDPTQVILRLPDFEVQSRTSQLLILASEPTDVTDEARPVAMPLVTRTLPQFGGPASIGYALFVDYMLPFQIVGLLLLSAMVGAIVLTQRDAVKPKPGRPTRRKVSRPLTSVIAAQTGHDVMEGQPQLKSPEEHPEPASN